VCGAAALRQHDLKRLVAYSSVVHMGAVGVGLSVGRELGRGGALLMVVGHGVCSPALFRYVYYVYQFTHSRLLCLCRGGRSAPLMLAVLAVLLMVNMGVPPFLNLWREVSVYAALLPLWLACWPVVGLSVFLRVGYGLFAYVRVTHGKAGPGTRPAPSPLPFMCSAAISLLLPLDIGIFI